MFSIFLLSSRPQSFFSCKQYIIFLRFVVFQIYLISLTYFILRFRTFIKIKTETDNVKICLTICMTCRTRNSFVFTYIVLLDFTLFTNIFYLRLIYPLSVHSKILLINLKESPVRDHRATYCCCL